MPGNDFPLRGPPPAWLASLDAPSQAEWRGLARESDPELYQEGLLHFASRQERRGREAVAGAIYQAMLETPEGVRGSVWERARQRGEVLGGGGPTGARAEFLLRRMTQELADPSMIAAMGAAGAVFRVTRLATLARLSSAAPAWLSRGWGAKGLASLTGFAVEAPTFTLAHRFSSVVLGHGQDWSSQALARDFSGSFLLLGAMKLGGAGAGVLRGLSASRGPVTAAFFQQGGMLGGILFSQALERRLGWRPAQSADAAVTDALAMWLQFNIAGRLVQGALGPRFQAWEGGVEMRSAMLGQRVSNPPLPPLFQRGEWNLARISPPFEKGGQGGIFPRPAIAGSAGAGRPPELGAPQAPEILMMTAGTGKGLTEPGRSLRPREVLSEVQSNPGDPRAPFFRVEAPRIARSDMRGDGERVFPYRLVLEDFNLYLREGADRAIARRDNGEIRLRLIGREETTERSQFLPAGLQGYRYEIREGSTRGEWLLYAHKDGLMTFSIQTEQMRPGAGGIVMDWMATQAAAIGRQSQWAVIHNPRIFEIIRKRGLVDERSAILEAHPWNRRHRKQSIPLGKFGDGDFLWRHRGGYFNLWAFPRKTLLPPELRSAEVGRERVSRGGETHAYRLRIEPFRDFFLPGHEATIATREGRDLKLRVLSSELSPRGGEFLPAGMPVVKVRLSEGERQGHATFHLNGESLELISINTPDMIPGAGGIFMDWLATQAAVQGRGFGTVYIENAKVLRILEDLGLMEAGTPLQEGYRVIRGIETVPIGPLQGHRNLVSNPFADFHLVRGRPSADLVPAALREPHQP